MYAAANPSGQLLHPECPKYSTARLVAQPLAENLPETHPQYYSVQRGQD